MSINLLTKPCSRENTVLRANLVPDIVHVIPNALVADQFQPASVPPPLDPSECTELKHGSHSYVHPVVIVVVSRLAYRKGVDLLVAAAPRICAAFPQVKFIIGKLVQGTQSVCVLTMLVRWRWP
jgi:phosphatidylinositol glycan class A protein